MHSYTSPAGRESLDVLCSVISLNTGCAVRSYTSPAGRESLDVLCSVVSLNTGCTMRSYTSLSKPLTILMVTFIVHINQTKTSVFFNNLSCVVLTEQSGTVPRDGDYESSQVPAGLVYLCPLLPQSMVSEYSTTTINYYKPQKIGA